jgi:hypothetical protein
MRECPRGGACRNYRAKPPVPQGDAVKTIPLSEGVYAYVDAADYEWLNQWHWWASVSGYALRREKGKYIFMHRQIMKPPPGKVTDHISGNKVDNTRANLRNVTPKQNLLNKRKRHGTGSLYKGVGYNKRRRHWFARISYAKRSLYLGHFDTEEAAARAYDYKAVELFGEFARPNFPDEWPAKKRRQVHAKWLREQGKLKARSL